MLRKLVGALSLAGAAAVGTCPGDTRSPYTCDQDSTHRVCATLMESCSGGGTKKQWGSQDFWALTNQEAFDWSSDICAAPNPGDSWCICMWATEELIEQVGCDSINLTCEGTDVCYVLQSYTDAGMTGNKDLSGAHDCITSKCPTEAAACSGKSKPKGAALLAQVNATAQPAAASKKATATHSMQA